MIYRHSQEDIDAYYADGSMNQSAIKVILSSGIQAFVAMRDDILKQADDLYYEEKAHFIIGSGVDCHMTMGKDDFENKFHVSNLVKKPGEKAMAVVKMAFDLAHQNYPNGIDINMEVYKEEIFNACNANDYYTARANKEGDFNLDTRVASIIKEHGKSYWEELYLSEGKQILSDQETSIINTIVENFRTHSHTNYLFRPQENVDIIYQFPMYWIYEDVACKGLVDMIIVNHTRKTISPIDIKTLGDYVLSFGKAVKKRRYDIQGSFYAYGLTQGENKKRLSGAIDSHLDGYTISNFAFVVESTVRPGTPLVYVLNDLAMEQGKVGDSEDLQGWSQALNIYKDWAKCDFSIEKKYEETNGVLFLDNNFLITN